MSETSASRHILAPYCLDPCIDIGFGGDPVTPTAITFDMAQPYTSVGQSPQMLRGDARALSFVCDGAFASVYSSHLVEDYSYADLHVVLKEWRRILRTGGNLVINAPDQQRFLAHCKSTGQGLNAAHKEQDFSFATFWRVLESVGKWDRLSLSDPFGPYSWLAVWRKASA